MESPFVILEVGDRRFKTSKATLIAGSDFFKAKFSGKWSNEKSGDGSYFVDADPDIFEHLLEHLRTGVMPLFWDKKSGHDFVKYDKLLSQARFFGVDTLQEWISSERYLQKASVVNAMQILPLQGPTPISESENFDRRYHVFDRVELKYLCKMGHQDERYCYGEDCGGAKHHVDKKSTMVMTSSSRVKFDHDI